MKPRLIHMIRTWPVFLWLLPVFFVIHWLTENFGPSLINSALWLSFIYILVASLLMGLCWLLYKDLRKASLIAFVIMAFNFFFGSSHDFLKRIAGNSFLVKYSFIIPASFILLIAIIIYVKKTKNNFTRTSFFLNSLLLLLIFIDLVMLFPKLFTKQKNNITDLTKNLTLCDSCARPDIYLIIADEYAGKSELQDIFSFNNSSFENDLANRGFHVVSNSRSNYNATVYSMASMLSMDYVPVSKQNVVNHPDMLLCRGIIKNNSTLQFFKKAGYSFYNYSFFELDNKKNTITNHFFPSKTALFNAQTFINRFTKNLGAYFASSKKIEDFKKNDLYNDIKIDSLTRNTASQKPTGPKFVYTHFSMPHHPYYLDSNGKAINYEKIEQDGNIKKAYIEYLLYANKKLLQLVDHIKQVSANPPVIILMSDHGFRQLPDNVAKKYYFLNLNAVYLPTGNYSGFHDQLSNVNQFRVILNSQFGQKIPLLKDSTVFLSESGF